MPLVLEKRLKEVFTERQAKVLAEVITSSYDELVKVRDFNELKGIVRELAEAQKRTEIEVEELAEAQKKTEIELKALTKDVQSLTKDVQSLTKDVQSLSEDVKALTRSHKDLASQVGGISHIIGYELEEKFYSIFPRVIKEDFGAEIETYLERKYLLYPDGREDEINIYAEGRLNGKKVYLIGESKAHLTKGDIDDFAKVLKRAKSYLKEELLPILLCYTVHPTVEGYLKEKYPNIKIYKSYELKRRSEQSERQRG